MNNDPNNKDEINYFENSSSNDINNKELLIETPESNKNNSVFPEIPQNDISTTENLGVESNQNNSVPVEPVNKMEEKPVVDMPRTVLETSANSNILKTLDNNPPPTAKKDNNQNNAAVPAIFFFIMICIGGYFAFNYFNSNNKPLPYYDNNEIENTKTEENDKEESKEEKEKSETTENEKTNQSTTSETTTPTTNDNTSSDNEIELMSGMTIYLYDDGGGTGIDDVMFYYISHTPSQIVVDVEINNNTERYTITPGNDTKIKGVKNKVVFKINKDNIGITFR